MAMRNNRTKTNAIRTLEAQKIPYELITFPPEVHSALGVANSVALPPSEVYKTLVALRPRGKAMLILIDGTRHLNLKKVARVVGEKKVYMASHREAEQMTGLQVGGISALSLLDRPFDVFIDRIALGLSHIVVSAGQRGTNVRLSVHDLLRITGAQPVDVSDAPNGNTLPEPS